MVTLWSKGKEKNPQVVYESKNDDIFISKNELLEPLIINPQDLNEDFPPININTIEKVIKEMTSEGFKALV